MIPLYAEGRNSGGTASVIAPTLSADRNFYLPDATGTALVDTLNSTISTNANIPPITLVHRVPGPNYTQYLLTWTVALSAPGTNCVGNTTVELDGIWTDPSGSANQSIDIGRAPITIAASGNGTIGLIRMGNDHFETWDNHSTSDEQLPSELVAPLCLVID